MDTTEATTNIVVALINNHCINTIEEISEAYKSIYAVVEAPYQQ